MAEHIAYARTVKAVESKNILTLISTIDVGANDLMDNINRLQSEGINLTTESGTWAVTKSIANAVSKSVPNRNHDTNVLDTIKVSAEVITFLTDYLKKAVTAYKTTIWSGESMSVRQVYILSTIEQLDFWIRYANKLIDVMLSKSQEVNFSLDKYLTKNELAFINGSAQYFSTVTIALLKGKSVLIKEIDSIPELDADDEHSADIMMGMGGKKPELSRGFGIHLLSPVYWYNSVRKEIDLMVIRSAQDQNEYLAMKINQAINQKTGSDDASLDHRIEVYRNKIIKNAQSISSITESYA